MSLYSLSDKLQLLCFYSLLEQLYSTILVEILALERPNATANCYAGSMHHVKPSTALSLLFYWGFGVLQSAWYFSSSRASVSEKLSPLLFYDQAHKGKASFDWGILMNNVTTMLERIGSDRGSHSFSCSYATLPNNQALLNLDFREQKAIWPFEGQDIFIGAII